MRERVQIIRGKHPILLVAAHGADDNYTAEITEMLANSGEYHAVINWGFERSDTVDAVNDQANCNRVDHVKQDIVFDEFLNPLLKIVNTIKKTAICNIFHIHGCGNVVHKEAGKDVGVIVGYGLGIQSNSLSCQKWKVDLFSDLFKAGVMLQRKDSVFHGKGGGHYAGRDINNMNQYFKKHQNTPLVDSMQLEFPLSVRENFMNLRQLGNVKLTFPMGQYTKQVSQMTSYTPKTPFEFI